MQETSNKTEETKWDFSDYAFTITGIIVFVLLVVPELLASMFDINILGGSLSNIAPELAEGLEYGYAHNQWSIHQLRALSPLLFLLTTTITFFYDAFEARKNGGYKGSLFTHTFESLFEESIYMAITTITVYSAVFARAMYASWLAGPITWIIFIFVFPLVRKKGGNDESANIPWHLFSIFAIGVIVEVITGAWIAFPLSWLIICVIKLVSTIRHGNHTIDTVFDILYYAFSVILLAVGISVDFWVASWAAFPIAILICWVLSKFGRFKRVGIDGPKADNK